jgi:lipoate-protein ligase B
VGEETTGHDPLCRTPGEWLCAFFRDAPYGTLWTLQTALVEAKRDGSLSSDVALFVEHQPVFTLGRRGVMENLKVAPAFLEGMGVSLFHAERGGDITYHGPGQLVLYPIVDLPRARLKVVQFVEGLEEVMIRTAADFGVRAERSPRNRGVWVGPKKLGSVGIAVRRGVSFHGLALNANTDLSPFSWINPCGLQGVRMTSLALEGARHADLEAVIPCARRHLEEIFCMTTREVEAKRLTALVPHEEKTASLDVT